MLMGSTKGNRCNYIACVTESPIVDASYGCNG